LVAGSHTCPVAAHSALLVQGMFAGGGLLLDAEVPPAPEAPPLSFPETPADAFPPAPATPLPSPPALLSKLPTDALLLVPEAPPSLAVPVGSEPPLLRSGRHETVNATSTQSIPKKTARSGERVHPCVIRISDAAWVSGRSI